MLHKKMHRIFKTLMLFMRVLFVRDMMMANQQPTFGPTGVDTDEERFVAPVNKQFCFVELRQFSQKRKERGGIND